MITLRRFRRLERALQEAGYANDSIWPEAIMPPSTAEEFAQSAIYVIVNSGMKYGVAQQIYKRCIEKLYAGGKARKVFGHPGKAKAIDTIWKHREELFAAFLEAEDKLDFCASLRWIGPVTRYHLAKDLGVDVAKPDVHLARLARRDRTTVERLCRRLAKDACCRVATVDTILWRACATGILDSRLYELEGWRAAFRGEPSIEH